jgi:tetratricopeptide (TPR) repeat protein
MNIIEAKLNTLKTLSEPMLSKCDTYLKQGNALFNVSKYIEAIESYDKCLTLNANINPILAAEAHYRKSFCFLRLDKFYQSIKESESCLAFDSKYVIAYVTKGFCYRILKRDDESTKMLNTAMNILDAMSFEETSSNNEIYKEYLLNRGLTLRGLKEYEKAMENYDKLIVIGEGPQFENG